MAIEAGDHVLAPDGHEYTVLNVGQGFAYLLGSGNISAHKLHLVEKAGAVLDWTFPHMNEMGEVVGIRRVPDLRIQIVRKRLLSPLDMTKSREVEHVHDIGGPYICEMSDVEGLKAILEKRLAPDDYYTIADWWLGPQDDDRGDPEPTEDEIERGNVQKSYDQGEARDRGGRWTSGGGDESRRQSEREGNPVRVLVDRVRRGEVSAEHLEMASRLGHEDARAVHGKTVSPVEADEMFGVKSPIHDLKRRHVSDFAADVAEKALPMFEAWGGEADKRVARAIEMTRASATETRTATPVALEAYDAASEARHARFGSIPASHAATAAAHALSSRMGDHATAVEMAQGAMSEAQAAVTGSIDRPSPPEFAWQKRRLAEYFLGSPGPIQKTFDPNESRDPKGKWTTGGGGGGSSPQPAVPLGVPAPPGVSVGGGASTPASTKKIPSKYQEKIYDWVAKAAQKPTATLTIDALAGTGKCLGKGTPVLMFDGTVIPVQDVQEGDLLMGPDGEPRYVHSASRGYGDLFEIAPVKGDRWVCNDVHVMTLVHSVTGDVVDLPLDKYLARRPADMKLFRAGVPFEKKHTALEPYLLGLWLGDGSVNQPIIHKPDQEIHDYLTAVAPKYGLEAKIRFNNERCPTISLTLPGGQSGPGRVGKNPVRNEVVRCYVHGEKRVPTEYLRNDREGRLHLLAGLLDTDGYYSTGYYEITTKYQGLRDDILFLARSLGFSAYSSVKVGRIASIGFEGTYYRISISGHLDEIPCRIERKKAAPRRQKKNVLRTGFTASYLGKGEYYGFTLSGDGRFLLGDFTVTHNTYTSLESMRIIPKNQTIRYMAFNNHVAKPLQADIDKDPLLAGRAQASTINSFGYSVLRSRFPGIDLEPNKVSKLVDEVVTNKDDRADWKGAIKDYVSKKKATWDPEAKSPTTDQDIFKKFEIDIPEGSADVRKRFWGACKEVWKRDQEHTRNGTMIDFDDQIYAPVVLNIPIPRYLKPDWVMIDEAQDLSPIQAALVRKIAPRTMIVGDPNQSIYAWRGADPESLDRVTASLNAERLPLSLSYRCSKAVVREAQKIVPQIEHTTDAREGMVRTIKQEALLGELQPGDFVLSYRNAPLVRPCLHAIASGKKAGIVGRSKDGERGISDQLKSLIEKAGKPGRGQKVSPDTDIISFTEKLHEYVEREMDKLQKANKDDMAEVLSDKFETIIALSEGTKTIGDLQRRTSEIFSENVVGIKFSSIHKSKGLEAERVFILEPAILEGRRARSEVQRKQMRNLKYVAITRAKDTLTWVTPPPEQR